MFKMVAKCRKQAILQIISNEDTWDGAVGRKNSELTNCALFAWKLLRQWSSRVEERSKTDL